MRRRFARARKGATVRLVKASPAGSDPRSPLADPSVPEPSPARPHDFVRVRGAREHNLKEISVDIPRGALVVFTGISGSGKSSLACGTLFAEAQRRYLESESPCARRLFDPMPVPEVGEIDGLPPAVALQQQRGARGDVLYLLDEPTTGLHPADVERLVVQLDALVTAGNTVVVVEHDTRVMAASDWILDPGPGAGDEGGRIVAAGTPEVVARAKAGRTAPYLAKFLDEVSAPRRAAPQPSRR